MSERALSFIEDYGSVIKDQVSYLEANDWRAFDTRKSRKEEHDLHLKIVSSFIDKIKYIESESGDDFLKVKKIKSFAEDVKKEVENYIDRCNQYFEMERWVDYGEERIEDKSDEMEFQNEVLKSMLKRREELSKINFGQERKDVKIDTWGEVALPIPMRAILEQRHPDVKTYIENKRKKK